MKKTKQNWKKIAKKIRTLVSDDPRYWGAFNWGLVDDVDMSEILGRCRMLDEYDAMLGVCVPEKDKVNAYGAGSYYFDNLRGECEPVVQKNENQFTKKIEISDLLDKSVNEFDLSARAANCLNNANIGTLGDLVEKSKKEMLKFKGLGINTLKELQALLDSLSLGFRGHSEIPDLVRKEIERKQELNLTRNQRDKALAALEYLAWVIGDVLEGNSPFRMKK